jgi:hypothetical protein
VTYFRPVAHKTFFVAIAYVLIPVGEDDTEGITAASQGKSARVNQNHTTVTPDSQAAKEMMARILARPARRFVAWPRR